MPFRAEGNSDGRAGWPDGTPDRRGQIVRIERRSGVLAS